ncbi:hypothetical protein ES703_54349 [subsurface metagenome]
MIVGCPADTSHYFAYLVRASSSFRASAVSKSFSKRLSSPVLVAEEIYSLMDYEDNQDLKDASDSIVEESIFVGFQ